MAAPKSGITELRDDCEFFACERSLPNRLHSGSVFGPVGEQLQHAVAHARSHAEDPLELLGGRLVDRQPSIVEVGHLDKGVGILDEVGQELALGQGRLDTLLQVAREVGQVAVQPRGLVERAAQLFRLFRQPPPRVIDGRCERAGLLAGHRGRRGCAARCDHFALRLEEPDDRQELFA